MGEEKELTKTILSSSGSVRGKNNVRLQPTWGADEKASKGRKLGEAKSGGAHDLVIRGGQAEKGTLGGKRDTPCHRSRWGQTPQRKWVRGREVVLCRGTAQKR